MAKACTASHAPGFMIAGTLTRMCAAHYRNCADSDEADARRQKAVSDLSALLDTNQKQKLAKTEEGMNVTKAPAAERLPDPADLSCD